jgi:hypothetical protein
MALVSLASLALALVVSQSLLKHDLNYLVVVS